jgi:S1-C subfamily serine protease
MDRIRLMATSLLLCGTISVSNADDLADKGRAIYKRHQHAVVTVQLVLKNKFSFGGRGGEANESRQDVTGTLVDASGLTVLSLSATDPSQLLQSMLGGGSDEDSRLKMETEISDVKILLADGTELPSEVVLRDRDLDLAFIRPKTKPGVELSPLDLSKNAKADILDQVITLNRLGNSAGRAYSASIERISAIVQRPRLFYVPDASLTTTTLGSPVFTTDGKILGVCVMRALKAKSGSGFGLMSLQPDNFTAIILPADDIAKAAKQVPAIGDEKESSKK